MRILNAISPASVLKIFLYELIFGRRKFYTATYIKLTGSDLLMLTGNYIRTGHRIRLYSIIIY